MKFFTFILSLLISITGYTQITLPIDFESTTIMYTFGDFDGGVMTLIDNPDQSGINMSAKVAQMVKGAGPVFAGSSITLDGPIDFSTNKLFKMKVWVPNAGDKVLLKVENSANGAINFEKEATTTTGGAWETLEFDYSLINTAESYDKIVLIFELGTEGDGGPDFTYYLDDIELVLGGGGMGQVDLPITFENPAIDYELSDFEGNGPSEIVVDPTDPNNMVAQVLKSNTAGSSAGTTMASINGLVNAIPFTMTETTMTVRVWSPDAGIPVRLKVEDVTDPTKSVETQVNTTVAMAWETLVFDFSNEAPGTAPLNLSYTFNMVSIFFNFGTDGATAGDKTYFWDDVEFVGGGPVQVDLPITFEDASVDYELSDFGGNASSIVVDPTDPNNMVGQAIRTAGAEFFAGTSMANNTGLANPVPFTMEETKMTVRVWSPEAGIPIKLKVENVMNSGISVETDDTTTVAMAWETLEFDFSNESPGTAAINFSSVYNKVSIFFNFNATGVGEQTYYWDDVEFVPTMAFTVYDVIANSPDHGTLETAIIAAGLVDDLSGDGPLTIFAPTDAAFAALPPGVLDALLADPMCALAQVLVHHAVSDSIVSADLSDGQMITNIHGLDLTVTIDGNNNVFIDGAQVTTVDLVADNGVVHVIDAVLTFEFVDVPVTFEDADVFYNLTDFGGNISSVVTDPTDPNNTVAQSIKINTAQTFAGTTMGNCGLANEIPFTATETKMKARVWSPDAGIQVRLKVEDATDPGKSVETEATTTVAMAWETLEFDFSNEATGTAPIDLSYTYDKASIFFNFGVDGATAGEKTYYWDDVQFGGIFTVVDIIVNSPDHDTLEDAVIAAELADDLSGPGPFTVFAPTDAAFAALPAGVLDALLLDPTGDLAQILLYHVLGAEVLSTDLTDGQMATTLQGEDITVTINGSDVFINQAQVTGADLLADNGVVHVIDAVLLPPSFVGVKTLNAADYNIKIAPNPANAYFYIEFPEAINGEVLMTLFDVSGKLMKQERIQDQWSEINTSDLNAGTYFLRIDTKDASYYQKVMIVK